jgi:hypothetical protein
VRILDYPQFGGTCNRCRVADGEKWQDFVDRALIDLKQEVKGQRDSLDKILLAVSRAKDCSTEDAGLLQSPLYPDTTEDDDDSYLNLAMDVGNMKRTASQGNANVMEDLTGSGGSQKRPPKNVWKPVLTIVTHSLGRASRSTDVSLDSGKNVPGDFGPPSHGWTRFISEDHHHTRRIHM